MHSSRMRTTHSSSRWGGGRVCLSACWDTHTPLGVGLETLSDVGLETPRRWPGDPLSPGCGSGALPGVGLETPQADQTPQLPPWMWV